MAKMNKNPALPAVEMLSRLKVLTKINESIAVIISPTGLPQNWWQK
jgi:hypothetical protein